LSLFHTNHKNNLFSPCTMEGIPYKIHKIQIAQADDNTPSISYTPNTHFYKNPNSTLT